MDETGISSVPNNPPKAKISTKGKRAVNKISSGERGTNVTVISAMSATGHFVPPAFIFGRKRMKAELLDGSPPGSIAMVSDSSFINADLFIRWLSHFKDHTKPTKENPVLLILDNHVSHTSIRAIDFYRDNNIIALTLPPHSSHKLQPLDRGFHVALKRYYSNECEKWLRNNPGRVITVFQMCKIFTPAFLKAATPTCATESFKTTGIWPYNPDVFSKADFLASSVTEREEEADFTAAEGACTLPQEVSIDNAVLPNSLAGEECEQNVSSKESKRVTPGDVQATPSAVLQQKEHQLNIAEAPQIPTTVASCSQHGFVKIADISPLPKSQVKRSISRKHKRSEVISSSPYKNEVQRQIEERVKPAKKAKNVSLRQLQLPVII